MTALRVDYSETQQQTGGELGRRPRCTCAVADKTLVERLSARHSSPWPLNSWRSRPRPSRIANGGCDQYL